MKILQNKEQIYKCRVELDKRNLSALVVDNVFYRILKKLNLYKHISIGDNLKSWDIYQTITFIENNTNTDAKILDIGCFSSEILYILLKMKFKNLYGIDLNNDLYLMPFADKLNLSRMNFLDTKFENNQFDVITAISVIEHGFNPDALFKEAARILKQDGYFIFSFDYWEDKINTNATEIFGMDWLIFSKDDVLSLLDIALKYNFKPLSQPVFDVARKPIQYLNFDYTFAWLVLQKAE